jgi:integrase/recombinase XerC
VSDLTTAIERYLTELRLRNASPHTLRNYGTDLDRFAAYFSPKDADPPDPAAFTPLHLREWLGSLYAQNLSTVSIRRKLAAVRSLFDFLAREGAVPSNIAKLVRTPKAPKKLPNVPTAEQTNTLLDGVAEGKMERAFPQRDLLIFELLYGCGLRISELVGLNLDDFDRTEQWIRVRGKGRKERQVPYGGKAAAAFRQAPFRPRRARHREVLRADTGGRFLAPSAQFAPRLRNAPAFRRRGPALHSRIAGALSPRDHAEVHAGVVDGFDGRLRQVAPQSP